LDDYSDSIERELEELRQKRGETQGLTVPAWNEAGHQTFWEGVEGKVASRKGFDIDDVEAIRKEAWERGKCWKAAAFNRKYMAMEQQAAPSSSRLLVTTGMGGEGGKGLAIATAQQMEDPGPERFVDVSSEDEREELPQTTIQEVVPDQDVTPAKKRKSKRVRSEQEDSLPEPAERETEFA